MFSVEQLNKFRYDNLRQYCMQHKNHTNFNYYMDHVVSDQELADQNEHYNNFLVSVFDPLPNTNAVYSGVVSKIIPIELTSNNPGARREYVIDTMSICNKFNAHALTISSIIFDHACIESLQLDSISFIMDGVEQSSITADLLCTLEKLEYRGLTLQNNKIFMASPFFGDCSNPLLKSNSKIIIRLTNTQSTGTHSSNSKNLPLAPGSLGCTFMYGLPKCKAIVHVHNFANPLLSVSNFGKITNYNKCYSSYHINQEDVQKRHKLNLNLNGNVESIVILLQPFNKSCKINLTGVITDGLNTMAILNPHINKLNYAEFTTWPGQLSKQSKYDQNIIIVPFSIRTAIGKNIDDGYYAIQSNNQSFEFELKCSNNINNTGSVFVQIWALVNESVVFPFEIFGYKRIDEFPQNKLLY